MALFLVGTLLFSLAPSSAWALPPLPAEAKGLSEDEQWLLWQSQFYPPATLPAHEWVTHESTHFLFHALPGTAAARDLPIIAREAEQSLRRIGRRLEMEYEGQLAIYLVERVFWQGGAAYGGEEVLISYLDRNYVDVPLIAYLDHELTHALAHTLIPEEGQSNALLAEGLAVWATGGHYGPEPIHAMAAALPAMGRAVPLARLMTDFRAEQHEIAYIQSASFVGWLIEQYGLERVKSFYGAADQPERFFNASYEELEEAWLGWLEQEWGREREEGAAWWEAQIRLFDTIRAYESDFDPVARELPSRPSKWSPEQRLRYRENVDAPHNIAMETQLIAASERLSCERDPAATHRLLDGVAEAVERGEIPAGGELAARLAVATRLAEQDRALRYRESSAFLASIVPELQERVAREMLGLARYGPLRQEVARLTVDGERASALVTWYPTRGGAGRAYQLTFQGTAEGWQVVEFLPVPTYQIVPRSSRLCRS